MLSKEDRELALRELGKIEAEIAFDQKKKRELRSLLKRNP